MAPLPPRPRTPLRRVSQGSLRALSRSGSFPDAPAGLGFLEPAMSELADETDTLHGNLAGLHALSNSLHTFNESFASYLYVMEMNALTTDWPQAPTETSYQLAKKRAEDDARAAQAALRAAAEAAEAAEKAAAAEAEEALANDTTVVNASAVPPSKMKVPSGILKHPTGLSKKKVKPKMTAKERRERSLVIEKVVMNLPLEYRGQDPSLRRHVESVIELLMDNPTGLEMINFAKLPDLNQARANKCLLALMNRKIVTKDNSSGRISYVWHGVAE
ncbi:DAM1 [Sanghuangporus weigelae]